MSATKKNLQLDSVRDSVRLFIHKKRDASVRRDFKRRKPRSFLRFRASTSKLFLVRGCANSEARYIADRSQGRGPRGLRCTRVGQGLIDQLAKARPIVRTLSPQVVPFSFNRSSCNASPIQNQRS